MKPRTSLLDLAKKSLETTPADEKRHQIFAANQAAIQRIATAANNRTEIGSLRVHPSIQGEAENQQPAPLVEAETFMVDLDRMTTPLQLGSKSLRSLIEGECAHQRISINSPKDISIVNFTPVVTALAGQHAADDVDCTDVTHSEFVPAFRNHVHGYQRVVALAYTVNGESDLRRDHVKLGAQATMTCLSRSASQPLKRNTALNAIEIPNLFAETLAEESPDMFANLQQSACMVIFLEYDLQVDSLRDLSQLLGGSGYATRGGSSYMMGGGLKDLGFAEKGTRGGAESGIAAYSVVGQGSSAHDHSTTIHESGQRKLKKVHVYLIGATVVNTKGETLTPAQADNVARLMKARANELSASYQAYKAVTYSNLKDQIERFVSTYQITTDHADILEHAMAHIGGMTIELGKSHFSADPASSQHVLFDFGLNASDVQDIGTNLRRRYGQSFCTFDFSRNGHFSLRVSAASLTEILPEIKETIRTLLSDERNLLAHQHHSAGTGKRPSYERVLSTYEQFVTPYTERSRKEFFTAALLNMFSFHDDFTSVSFHAGKSYASEALDTVLSITLPRESAERLVEKINLRYSPNRTTLARFLGFNNGYTVNGAQVAEIAIDSRILLSDAFQADFKNSIANLRETNIAKLDSLRVKSKLQSKTGVDHAKALIAIEALVNQASLPQSSTELTLAIKHLSAILADLTSTFSERVDASYKVTQSIARVESRISAQALGLFKAGPKKQIKAVQKDLGLLPKQLGM